MKVFDNWCVIIIAATWKKSLTSNGRVNASEQLYAVNLINNISSEHNPCYSKSKQTWMPATNNSFASTCSSPVVEEILVDAVLQVIVQVVVDVVEEVGGAGNPPKISMLVLLIVTLLPEAISDHVLGAVSSQKQQVMNGHELKPEEDLSLGRGCSSWTLVPAGELRLSCTPPRTATLMLSRTTTCSTSSSPQCTQRR